MPDTPLSNNLQAIRSVNKYSRNTRIILHPDDIVYVDIHTDPTTKDQFVLWDDILQVFDDAHHVRYQAKAVPFLKGADLNPYVNNYRLN